MMPPAFGQGMGGGAAGAALAQGAAGLIGNPAAMPQGPPGVWQQMRQAWMTGGPGGSPLLGAMLGAGGGGAIGGALGMAAGTAITGDNPFGGIAGAAIGRMIGRIPGAVAHMAIQSLQGMEEREISLLRLGDTLNQRFGTLRQTMKDMRHDFQILGQDGVNAMQAIATATGLPEEALGRTTYATVGAGRYYGMEAEESAGVYTALHMAGTRNASLRAVLAIGREAVAQHPGAMPVSRFAQEVARAAPVGGLAWAPMSEEFIGRNVQAMMDVNARYAANPAQAVLERAQQMGNPTSTIGQVLVSSSLDQLRQRQRFVTIGKGTKDEMRLDLNNIEDMRIARQQFFAIPEARDMLRESIVREAPDNPLLQRRYFELSAFDRPAPYQARREWETMQERARVYGSEAAYFSRPADVAAQEALEKARAEEEKGQIGRQVRETRAVPEEMSETILMRIYEQIQNTLLKGLGNVAQTMNDNEKTMTDFFSSIANGTVTVQSFFDYIKQAQASAGPAGNVLGPAVLPTAQDLVSKFLHFQWLPDTSALSPRRAFSR